MPHRYKKKSLAAKVRWQKRRELALLQQCAVKVKGDEKSIESAGKRQERRERKCINYGETALKRERAMPPVTSKTLAALKKFVNNSQTVEESEVLLLADILQKLEKDLSSEMQSSIVNLTKNPCYSGYLQLSTLTAVMIMLFNKPRADKAMKLMVASCNGCKNLDPTDETWKCLSSVEKKLCERLEVVKIFSYRGKLVPLLITPEIKKAMELLIETRSLVDINLQNPYIFAKQEKGVVSMSNCEELVKTHTESVGLLQDARLQNHVAAICQIMAMHGDEKDWLVSQIVNSEKVDIDVHSLQSSAHEVGRVVSLMLHRFKSEQARFYADSTVSQIWWSDMAVLQELWINSRNYVQSNPDFERNSVQMFSCVHACVFCGVLSRKMKKHLLHTHANERKVTEASTNSVPHAFRKLLRQGDHSHNMKVLQEGKGALVVLFRQSFGRCKGTNSPEDYMPCPDCLGYVFFAEFLSHRQQCKLERKKADGPDKCDQVQDKTPAMHRQEAFSAVSMPAVIKSKAFRNFVILMLSDATVMLPRYEKWIIPYEKSIIAASNLKQPAEVSGRMKGVDRLLEDVNEGNNTGLTAPFGPSKINIIFTLIRWLYDHSRQEDSTEGDAYLIQSLVFELGHYLVACVFHLKDELKAEVNNITLLSRMEKYLSLFEAMTGEVSVQACSGISSELCVSARRAEDMSAEQKEDHSEDRNIVNEPTIREEADNLPEERFSEVTVS